MKTIYLKLITGQYIIGDLEFEDEKNVVVKKPVGLEFNPMAGGLGFMPYDAMYLGKELEKVDIKKEHIMHKFEPPKEIMDQYVKFKTGIDLNPEMPSSNNKPELSEDQLAALAGLMAAGGSN